MVSRNEQYMPFIWTLKNKEFIKALKLVYYSPWIILVFFCRAGNSIAYQAHRVWNNGRTRGVK